MCVKFCVTNWGTYKICVAIKFRRIAIQVRRQLDVVWAEGLDSSGYVDTTCLYRDYRNSLF